MRSPRKAIYLSRTIRGCRWLQSILPNEPHNELFSLLKERVGGIPFDMLLVSLILYLAWDGAIPGRSLFALLRPVIQAQCCAQCQRDLTG